MNALSRFLGIALLCAGIIWLVFFSPGAQRYRDPQSDAQPALILWAWERPEDLRFIPVERVGVAYLAETIFLTGGQVWIRKRLQPLALPLHASMTATIRIESDPRHPPVLSPFQRDRAESSILALLRQTRSQGLQIDFDARASERVFYRQLLERLHHHLPEAYPLSITALASWCTGDPWIEGLPVHEAVPMLFQMGPGIDSSRIHQRLSRRHSFPAALCNHSIGLATTDLSWQTHVHAPRIYLFSLRKAWSKMGFIQAQRQLEESLRERKSAL